MKYLLPLLILAGPAVAHPGAHVHPHDGAQWLIWVSVLTVAVAAAIAYRGRK